MTIKSIKTGWTGISALAGNEQLGDFESIATQTVSSSVSSVTFSSIPSTYTHLQIRVMALTSSANNNIRMRFNSDTASNYSTHELTGSGAAISALSSLTTGMYPTFSPGNTHPGVMIIDVLDYKDTNKYTTIRSLWGYDNNGSGYLGLSSGSWRNTNAVTSIEFTHTLGGATISANSHFALYGIKG
jgi:hypothetical protein